MLGIYFLQAIAVAFVVGVGAGICYLVSRVWLAIFDADPDAAEEPASDDGWTISFHHSDGSVFKVKAADVPETPALTSSAPP